MIRAILAALALAACASQPHDRKPDPRAESEQGEEGVKRMQDEFNTLFPDA